MHRCRHDIERSMLALCVGKQTSISEIYRKFSESGPPLKYSDIKRHISIMLELHWITPVDLENLASLELAKNIGASKGTGFQFKLTGYHYKASNIGCRALRKLNDVAKIETTSR